MTTATRITPQRFIPGHRMHVDQRGEHDCLRACIATMLRARYDDLPELHGDRPAGQLYPHGQRRSGGR